MAQNQQPYSPKVILITKATFFDVDKLGATAILGKLLADKHHTTVDIYFDIEVPRAELTRVVAPRSINFIESLEASYFTISIERGNARVKEVKWEEQEDKIRLLVFTEKGEVDGSKYMIDPGSPHYDIAYSIGIKSEQDLLSQLGEFGGIWSAAETANVDIRGENAKFAQTNHIYADAKSYAEAILSLAEELDLEIPPQEATELLACLYWKTNSLRNRHTSANSFTTVDSLLKRGASLSQAVTKIYTNVSLLEIKARQEMLSSLVLDSDKVAISKVNSDTAKQLAKHPSINPNKNPLFIMRDTAASFVLVPIAEDKTLVLLSTPDDRINARKLFGQYNYVGDRLQAEMTFDTDVVDTEKKIREILDQKVFSRKTSSTKEPTPQPSPEKKSPMKTEKETDKSREQQHQSGNKEKPINDRAKQKSALEATEAKLVPSGDPLTPATETIIPKPTSSDAPAAGGGFDSLSPIGGFGGGMGANNFASPSKDPLPAAG